MFHNGELPVVIATVAASAITFIFLWVKRNRTKDAGKRYPPSASVLSVLVAVLRGGMNVLPEHFMKSADKLGSIISYKLGGRLVIILNGREAISEAFVRRSEAFADRDELWQETNVFNSKLRGIIFARYNETFKKYHKLCLAILKEFGFGHNSVSETRILREVESMNEELLKLNGSAFDPKPLCVLSTFNVTSSILFGSAFVSSGGSERIAKSMIKFVKNSDNATNFAPFLRFVPYFYRKTAAMALCHTDILSAIDDGIEFNKSTDCNESTFVKRFIEIEGRDYDHQDLLFIIRDLCFGSGETVSTTLQWAMIELANHPAAQNRFQREIDYVVPKDRLPSLDDKPRLPYTEAVILEVMRRHTAIPFFVPHQTLKDTEVFGLHIPKGCLVFANGISAHKDPKSWTDPENFRPERFLDKDDVITGSENVISFSLGKRSCLGESLGRQKTFLFLASLIQRFDIRPPEGQNLIGVKEIIAGATHPTEFKVRLIPRTKIAN